jgi:hypothetical protein
MTDGQPSQVAGAAKEEGSQVASTAVDQGKQTASAAADAGSQVVGAGAEGARQVAAEAAGQAGEVTRQATEQARDFAQQAQSQLRDQAGTQAQRAASGLRDVGQQVRALSEGRSDEAGVAADAARQVAEKIDALAGRIDERGFEGTVDDLREFARRRPGLFLLGAAATGFAVTRLGRGLQASQQAQQAQQGGPPAQPAAPPPPAVAAPTIEAPRSPSTTATGPTTGGR